MHPLAQVKRGTFADAVFSENEHLMVECAWQKQMTLWKCESGHDVRGLPCPPGVQHIGDSSKTISCHSVAHELKYGRNGAEFSYASSVGCTAAGRHPDIRAELECPAPQGEQLTDAEAFACANKLCMKVGAIA